MLLTLPVSGEINTDFQLSSCCCYKPGREEQGSPVNRRKGTEMKFKQNHSQNGNDSPGTNSPHTTLSGPATWVVLLHSHGKKGA